MDYNFEINDFINGYITCALWSSTDDAGDPLDGNYDKSDIEDESLYAMVIDCYNFFRENEAAWIENGHYSSERAGHDFWLTRNRHGAGFWDRDELPEVIGEVLTNNSEGYGEANLLVGDNGKLFYS